MANDGKLIRVFSWGDPFNFCSIYSLNGWFTINWNDRKNNKKCKCGIPKSMLTQLHYMGTDLLNGSEGDTKSIIGNKYAKDGSGKSKFVPVLQIDLKKNTTMESAFEINITFVEENRNVSFPFTKDDYITVLNDTDMRIISKRCFMSFITTMSPSSINVFENMSLGSSPSQSDQSSGNNSYTKPSKPENESSGKENLEAFLF